MTSEGLGMSRILAVVMILLWMTNVTVAADEWKKGTRQSVLIEQGAVRLSASQGRSMLAGSTEAAKYARSQWPVTYHAADGFMHIKRPNGKQSVEPYRLRSDGGVCCGPSFKTCHYVLRLKGELVVVRFERPLGVAKIECGKRL